MDAVLDIKSQVAFEDSIANYEMYSHQPYTNSFKNNDEIRIVIQHQDQCILPSKSVLHIRGTIKKQDGTVTAHTTLVNNAICHLFSDIRYCINGEDIDRAKNVGITSLMKGMISLKQSNKFTLENAGWVGVVTPNTIDTGSGDFDISIPLAMLLGFAEDYRKVVVNVKHELILTRANNDIASILQTENEAVVINLDKIEWLMPSLMLTDRYKISLLKSIQKDDWISMPFRRWELFEYPQLPETTKHVWTIKTANNLERPRYVILGFQTNRSNIRTRNTSEFDSCRVTNVKLYLNSQQYPYGNLNIDFGRGAISLLYDMYSKFQESYYGTPNEPMLDMATFRDNAPLFVIDCSKQNESLKSGSVDVRLEFESSQNFPAHTSAKCLILNDRIVKYKPISGEVKIL